MNEAYILCEGYYDRAFWKGWLTFLGCSDPGIRTGKSGRSPITDPWGNIVSKGHFAYRSPVDLFIRIVPCGGKERLLPAARLRLRGRKTEELAHLIICMDSDSLSTTETARATAAGFEALRAEYPGPLINSDDYQLDGETTRVSAVVWRSDDPLSAGIPERQTLERLICSAVAAAYPERGKCAHDWLNARANPPGEKSPYGKELAWSYMAGWHAEHGPEFFFSHLWEDQPIRDQLIRRLQQNGSWQIVEKLINTTPSQPAV